MIASACLGYSVEYQGYHFVTAVKHCVVLGYNQPEAVAKIQNEKEKSAGVVAWWQIIVRDGLRSVFNRLQPVL